mgnify:CR=1 FL=1
MSSISKQTQEKIGTNCKALIGTLDMEINAAIKKLNFEGRLVALVTECVEKEVEAAKKLL